MVKAIDSPRSELDFVWLELTNRCNLQCIHCYAESGPTSGRTDILSEKDYLSLLEQIYNLGCRKIQFIGGEPTLNSSLPDLIQEAWANGFEFIEVFTNLTYLSDSLLYTFQKFHVHVATSFYSWDPVVHDAITRRAGSHVRTVRNIRRVINSDLSLRVGVILMNENFQDFTATKSFLLRLGVKHIGSDRVRAIGRAHDSASCSMGELCGSCTGRILSIAPDGKVSPCNMSRAWSVGSVQNEPLSAIVSSPKLQKIRVEIGNAVSKRRENMPKAICAPKTCAPYSSCCPTTQSCGPCSPNGCSPCFPKG